MICSSVSNYKKMLLTPDIHRVLHKRIQKINFESTLEAERRFRSGLKTSKSGVLISLLTYFFKGLFLKSHGKNEGRFPGSFFYTFQEFLTQLKLLKLTGKM
ncbi:MAG: hypothetical protein N2510_02235 [Ignavibacteria bacterium]|nr:hypothetical protein [Ignavibacteria bacterium]